MIASFAAEERMETGFLVSIIVFGDRAILHLPPTSASSVEWSDMTADSCTAIGAAFSLAKGLIEDKTVIPSRAFRPTVVLVSDGRPTDDWKQPLEFLIAEGRSSKFFFMAMGIGENTGMQVLERFISRTPVLAEVNGTAIRNGVFRRKGAHRIHEFFRQVTMSGTMRSRCIRPNDVPRSVEANKEEGRY